MKRRFKKKSIFKRKNFWIFLLLLLILLALVYFLYFSGFFALEKINLSENVLSEYYSEKIKEKLNNYLGYNLLFLNAGKIEKMILNEYSFLKEVNTKRKLPDEFILQISERKPLIVFCSYEECFFLDKEGIAFKKNNLEEKKDKITNVFLTEAEGFGSKKEGDIFLEKDKLDRIVFLKERLENDFYLTKIILAGDNRLNVKVEGDWEIYFDLSSDIELALTKLKLLFEKEIPPSKRGELQYIDLRFSKVYYK